MKNKIDKILYLILIIVLITFIIMVILLSQSEKKKSQIYIHSILDKIVFNLMDAYKDNQLYTLINRTDAINGFGIYDIDGRAVITTGNAPLFLKNVNRFLFSDYLTHNKIKKEITLIKGIEPRMGFMRRRHHMMQNSFPNPPEFEKVVFLNYKSKYLYNQNTYLSYIGIFLITFFFVILMSGFIFLYNTNIKYKNKIAKQQQLIKLGEASRTLTHEIKNPLSAIKMQTALLKKILNNQSYEELDIINNEVDRLKLLSDKVGDFLRDPFGTPERLHVKNFMIDYIKKYHDLIFLSNELNEDIYIYIDKIRFISILDNLIVNAMESEDENRPIKIEIKIFTKHKRLYIQLIDNGTGINQDDIEKIFDPFFTTKTKGSGLGLSVVKNFIEQNQGKIYIGPGKQNGTIVTLEWTQELS